MTPHDITPEEIAAARRHEHRLVRTVVVCGAVIAALVLLVFVQGRATSATVRENSETVAALAEALDASREQVERCADMPAGTAACADPVAPAAAELIADPTLEVAAPVIIREAIDPLRLASAARVAVEQLVPGIVDDRVGPAVTAYVDECVTSGRCVGPPGAAGRDGVDGVDGTDGDPGAAGAPPTGDDVAAAVRAVCADTPEVCGGGWTEAELESIALRVVTEYNTHHRVQCPALNTIPRDEPFLCDMVVG